MSVAANRKNSTHRRVADKKLNPDDGATRRKRQPHYGGQYVVPRAPRSDEDLLVAYQQGESSAFGQLMERYQKELFHFLIRFLGNRAAAEDIFQETFLQVHQSAALFDPQRRFRPWLFTIAANKARDLMRSNARRPASALHAPINGAGGEDGSAFIDLMEAATCLPEEPLMRRETRQQVQELVRRMPDHLREVIILSYFHQFPYKEIADILQVPLGTVKSRLHAAVGQFAQLWKNVNRPSSAA